MRSNGATSGSAFSAAAATGEENVFFGRGARFVVNGAGRRGVFAELESREFVVLDARGTDVATLLSSDGVALLGDFKGVLNGERNGLERVWEAVSILRRFAAGVDMLMA